MNRAATLILVILVFSATLAQASPSTVAPGARLYVYFLEPRSETRPDNLGPRDVVLHIVPTGDAPPGHVEGRATLTITRFGDDEVVYSGAQDVSAEIPPQDERQGMADVTQSVFHWDARPGLYNLTATLYGDDGGLWATRMEQHQVGYSSELASGWGQLLLADDSDADLDGDGEADLWLRDPTTGDAVRWNMTITTRTMEVNAEIRRELEVFFYAYPQGRAEAIASLPQENASRILGGALLRQSSQAYAPLTEVDGAPAYTLHLPEIEPGGCCGYSFSVWSLEPLPKADTWYDGYTTRVNLTYLDVDADGVRDLSFWNSTADTADEAAKQDVPERRKEPAQLEVQVVVQDVENGTEIGFEMERADRGHDGAWIEVADLDAAFDEVLARDGDGPNGTPAMEVALPRDEGFVDDAGNESWAWVGHFSKQRIRVFVPDGSGGVCCDVSVPGETGMPAPAFLLVVSVVVGVAMLRAARGSRGS